VIERAVVLETGSELSADHLELQATPAKSDEAEMVPIGDRKLETVERHLIERVLKECQWQRTMAAKILGIHRTTLTHKVRQYGLEMTND
jgi:DNA-binding NtrC family response regulator